MRFHRIGAGDPESRRRKGHLSSTVVSDANERIVQGQVSKETWWQEGEGCQQVSVFSVKVAGEFLCCS